MSCRNSELTVLVALISKSRKIAEKLGLALVAIRLTEAIDLIEYEQTSFRH